MITDRPCCDNCPHYAVDKAACGEPQDAGFCLYDSPSAIFDDQGKPKIGYYHVASSHRCSNHLFIAEWSTEFWPRHDGDGRPGKHIAEDWRHYIDELPFILDVFAGGGDKAVRDDGKGGAP